MKKKVSKKEFTINEMPHNRPQVFFDIVKNRFSTLLFIGFIVLLFSIPLIITDYLTSIVLSNLKETTNDFIEIQIVIHTQNILYIFGLMILAIGLSGSYKIIRMLIWQEGIIFWDDFKAGIKSNCKYFVITALIIGIFNFAFNYIYYAEKVNQYAFFAVIVAAVFFLPTVIFTLGQTILYNLPYLHITKNSFLLAWRMWYTSIPVLLLNASVIVLLLIPNTIVYLILIFTLPLVVSPMLILFNTLYTDTIFDKFINKENFQEIVDKGIYRNGSN